MSARGELDLERLVRGAIDALNRGELEEFVGHMHPDVEFTSMIAEVEGETFRGHDGVRRWWATVRDAFDEGFWDLREIGVDGERGVAYLHISGRMVGVPVAQGMWQAFRGEDGLARWWAFFRDEDEAREAVGLPR